MRHGRGKVVAIIEIVSPGNKESRNAIRSFVEKAESRYIQAPLETTYQQAWAVFPALLKELIDPAAG
jgi:hypothetical protein